MQSIEDIRSAISQLSPSDRASLLEWLADLERAEWDAQITADFSGNGPGAKWLTEIDGLIRAGHSTPME